MTDEPTANDLGRFFPQGSHPLWRELSNWFHNQPGPPSATMGPLGLAEVCYDRGYQEGKYQGANFGPYVPWSNYHELWEKVKRLTERVDRLDARPTGIQGTDFVIKAQEPNPMKGFLGEEKSEDVIRRLRGGGPSEDEIQRRIAAAVEAEREACAIEAERLYGSHGTYDVSTLRIIADRIRGRARGKEVKP